jgi:GNAT superfamily N-acetyltransferase
LALLSVKCVNVCAVLSIRLAGPSDLAFIVASNQRLAQETEHLQLNSDTLREGVRAMLEGRVPGRYWIAERDGEPVAQLMITFEWSDWRNRMIWWIQSVYVAPEARKFGVFRALYGHAKAEAQAAGAGGLRLYVDTSNTRAQAVYTSIGMNGDHYRVFEEMF